MNNKFYIDDKDKNPVKLVNKKEKFNILKKIIPAILVFTFVIGLANSIDFFDIDNLLPTNETNSSGMVVEEDKNGSLTNITRVVEKSIFENLIALIPENKTLSDTSSNFVKNRIKAYYILKESDTGAFYVFADPRVSKREIAEILGYWNEYIGWNDAAYFNMLVDYQMLDNIYLQTVLTHSSFMQ